MTAKLVVPGSETLDQASNDVALTTANASFAIDVVANDRGGSARHLYSLDQTNPSAIQTFAQSKLGAAIKIIDGQVLYDPIASANDQALTLGETLTDTFPYVMQVGNGKISVGTVTVTVTGTNVWPRVSDLRLRGGAEGAGAFTVNLLDHASDVDHGAVLHVADVVWTDPHTSSGLPPGFSMGANGTLIVDANDPAYNSLAVDEAKTWTFSYDVVDEHGASVRQTAAITITGANDRNGTIDIGRRHVLVRNVLDRPENAGCKTAV